jgi:hypothetical protein
MDDTGHIGIGEIDTTTDAKRRGHDRTLVTQN